MRISEITEDSSSQEGTLMTLIQYLLAKSSANTNTPPVLTFPTNAIIKMMNNTGAAITYPDLNALIKNSSKLKKKIKSITPDKITINDSSAIPPANPETSPTIDPGQQEVEKMASRATSRI